MDYPYIRAWGRHMGSNLSYIADQVSEARKDKAPEDATFKSADTGEWHTMRDFKGTISLDIRDSNRNRAMRQRRELATVPLGVHERERDVARLELDPVVQRVRVLLETEHLPIELRRLLDIVRRHGDEVDALRFDHGA